MEGFFCRRYVNKIIATKSASDQDKIYFLKRSCLQVNKINFKSTVKKTNAHKLTLHRKKAKNKTTRIVVLQNEIYFQIINLIPSKKQFFLPSPSFISSIHSMYSPIHIIFPLFLIFDVHFYPHIMINHWRQTFFTCR